MQKNYSRSEGYIYGMFKNIKMNLLAGTIIVIISFIIHVLTGCEQPELTRTNQPIQNIISKDSIADWETDTTTYHSNAVPNK